MAELVVLGGDGYIGWPLALELATTYPEKTVLVVDNFMMRRHSAKVGASSLLPIRSMAERIEAYREATGLDNLRFLELDVSNPDQMTGLFTSCTPEVVYHLAHQRAAPYSMLGLRECIETVTNNEVGFLNLIWLLKEHAPDCHLVKLGSFGAYAKPGLDIPEGDCHLALNGKVSAVPAPFPRASDDFYHITKINDGNFAGLACRKWGLRISDVMQSTVFGAATERTLEDRRLHTRFDYDGILGTVVNRFVTQAVAGLPLTVYGSGSQTTGIMVLADCVRVLAHLAADPCDPGTHRLINNSPRIYSINELAEMVRDEGNRLGMDVRVSRNRYNPRFETGAAHDFGVETAYLHSVLEPTPLRLAVARSLEILAEFGGDIQRSCVEPTHDWIGGAEAQADQLPVVRAAE
jgi:UDP-sulfoquinovose synthase